MRYPILDAIPRTGGARNTFSALKPDIHYNVTSGEVSLSLGKGQAFDPSPIAPDVFALPGELTENAGFRMAHLSR